MEKEKIKQKLDFHKELIKEVTTDAYQFKRNIESECWIYWMDSMFNNIEIHETYIYKEVYPKLNNFSYTDVFYEDALNKVGEKILYTQELHNAFLINYKIWIIERLQSYNEESFFNSASLIQNCVELWKFEQRREIIKFLKEL